MFDIGWSELVVIAVVALIAIGPKELPGVLRMVGQWMGKARKMAGEFQGQFQEAMREAEMADLKKTFDEVKDTATGFASNNVMTSLQKDVSDSLQIEDLDKPDADAQVDLDRVTVTPEIVTPTTPAAADARNLCRGRGPRRRSEPLVITREVQAQPAPQDITPSAPDVLKDAKAS